MNFKNQQEQNSIIMSWIEDIDYGKIYHYYLFRYKLYFLKSIISTFELK